MNYFTIDLGKYTYEYNKGEQTIYRYGEEWRDETGDNLIFAMARRILELQEELDDVYSGYTPDTGEIKEETR